MEEQPQSPTNLDTLSISDNSSTFSECNSDRSGEFSTTSSSSSRHLFLACCTSENSDTFISQLVTDLHSTSTDHQKQAAMQIRLLSKHNPDNRLKIAKAGAIPPLIALLSSTLDPQLQEYAVTAILNLSLCSKNKEMLSPSSSSGGRCIRALVRVLREGNSTAKENSACALLRLSEIEENKAAIGRSGAVPLLVDLLETGGIRGKKDASTALYSLCSVKENKVRAVKAGVVKVLVELMADFGSKMVDKCACVMNLLVSVKEGRAKVVEEGGIPVLVEIVEVGTQRQKEIAVAVLLQICQDSAAYRVLVGREGALPPLVELCQSGTNRARQKAETLIELLRQPRRGFDNVSARTSDVST